MPEPVAIALRATAEIEDIVKVADSLEQIGESGAKAARQFEELRESSNVRGIAESLRGMEQAFSRQSQIDLPEEELRRYETAARDASKALETLESGGTIDEQRMERLSKAAQRISEIQFGWEEVGADIRGIAGGSEELKDLEGQMMTLQHQMRERIEDGEHLSKQEKRQHRERLESIKDEIESYKQLRRTKQDAYSTQLREVRTGLETELREGDVSPERERAIQEALEQIDVADRVENMRLQALGGREVQRTRGMIAGAPEAMGMMGFGRRFIPGFGALISGAAALRYLQSSIAQGGELQVSQYQLLRMLGSATESPDVSIEDIDALIRQEDVSSEYAMGTTQALAKTIGSRLTRTMPYTHATLESMYRLPPGTFAPVAGTELFTKETAGMQKLDELVQLQRQQNLGTARLPELTEGLSRMVEQLSRITLEVDYRDALNLLRSSEYVYGVGSGRGTGQLGTQFASQAGMGMPQDPFTQTMVFRAFADEQGIDMTQMTDEEYRKLYTRIAGPRGIEYRHTFDQFMRDWIEELDISPDRATLMFRNAFQEVHGFDTDLQAMEYIENQVMTTDAQGNLTTPAFEQNYQELRAQQRFREQRQQAIEFLKQRGQTPGEPGSWQMLGYPKLTEVLSPEEQATIEQEGVGIAAKGLSGLISGVKVDFKRLLIGDIGEIDFTKYTGMDITRNPLATMAIQREINRATLPSEHRQIPPTGETSVNVNIQNINLNGPISEAPETLSREISDQTMKTLQRRLNRRKNQHSGDTGDVGWK